MNATVDKTTLPIFGPQLADCAQCELKVSCDRNQVAYAYRPPRFNGIMIVGEGPGRQEVIEGRPFVGPSGKLLRATCESVGIELDDCYITNATLCKPPPPPAGVKDKGFMVTWPTAVTSCLPRLEAEIAAVRPRIILALGQVAWAAISGYDRKEVHTVPFECNHCDPSTRRVGPVLQCSAPVPNAEDGGKTAKPCGQLHFLNPRATAEEQAREVELIKARGCTGCGAKMTRLRPKMVKCPVCGGRKRRQEEVSLFTVDYNVSAAAGAIFEPGVEGRQRAEHELHHWLRAHGVEYVIPTYHPAFVLRGQQFLAKTIQKHIQKATQLLVGQKPVEYSWTKTSDPAVVREFCLVPPPQPYTVDIETLGRLDPSDPNGEKRLDATEVFNVGQIRCMGIGRELQDGSIVELVVDTQNVDPSNPDDPLLAVLYEFMADTRRPKTFHHGGGYDLPVLDLVWGFPVNDTAPSYTDDTLCSHKNLYPDEPHDLSHVATEAALLRAWKPPRTSKGAKLHGDFDGLAAYNARDVAHTTLARRNHGVRAGVALPGDRMDRAGLADVYAQDSLLRQEALRMTMRGMPLNRDIWAKVEQDAQTQIASALASMREALDQKGWGEFNPRSVPQRISVLHKHPLGFGLPALKVDPQTQTPKTDSVTLRKLLDSTKDPLAQKFVQGLVDLLKIDYVDRNFIKSAAMQPWADGRIHPIWTPWGAKTGRWSSSPNAQNWPKWLRAAIVAALGRKIVGIDYDQLELRNMAFLTGDPGLIDKCLNADETRKLEPEHDPHSYIAAIAFRDRFTGLSLNDPKHVKGKCTCETCKRKLLRDITKRVIYGLNYGAGDAKVVEAIYDGGYEGPPITLDMVGLVRRTVFTEWPGVPRWRDEQVRRAAELGELRSPLLGRRRIFPLNEVPAPETYNYPIQAMGADIINTQMLLVLERLPQVDPSAFVIAQVHDALYVEASEGRAGAVAQMLTETLTVELEMNGVVMPFTATGSVADNWKEAA